MKIFEKPERQRGYIARLLRDPRTKAMHDGWIAQATFEAEEHCGDRYDAPRMAQYAADRAIQLAMSFVLDNDGELNAVREQMEKLLEANLTMASLSPRPIVIPTDLS